MKRLYLDVDGVLADFNLGFQTKFDLSCEDYETLHGTKAFWQTIRNDLNFFGTLPLMPDALELYNAVKHLRPILLTGVPFGGWAEQQKFGWRDMHFPGVPMVTCRSKDKALYCQPGDILVDDITTYKHLWEAAGGIYIVHTSANQSIKELNQKWIN
jgi:hypothetical protein